MIPTMPQLAQSLFSLTVVVVWLAPASAQVNTNFETSVRAAMAPSIASQRSSVEKQAASLVRPKLPAGARQFFVLPIATDNTAVVDCEPMPKEELDSMVDRAAQTEGVGSDLVHAVVEEESGARPCAVSPSGAVGLMQLMPSTADDMQVENPFDPEQNVEAGTKLLKFLLNKYDDNLPLALGAYNAGASRVDEEGDVPQIPETLKYVADIVRKLSRQDEKKTVTQP
jgi:soluble lytic murein transglycosylase-like protein